MSIFSSIKRPRVKRSKFDLSRELKASYAFNKLYPTFIEEVIPGDSFRIKVECLLRAFPMLAPLMHRVNVKMNFFFVPTRILWNEWEDFITGGRLGDQSPVLPYIAYTAGGFPVGGLGDHFGVPPNLSTGGEHNSRVNCLPFRAYQMIFNEYFRDQNLEAPVAFGLGSGQVTDANERDRLLAMRVAAWEKDYFTSALPWPQRGPEVTMPLVGVGDVTYKQASQVKDAVSGNNPTPNPAYIAAGGLLSSGETTDYVRIENIDEVTIENAETTINDFRKAVAIQRWLEMAARAGSRYVEQVLVHFGVHTGDARLDRPEYIGGYSQPLSISEVLSTVDDTANDLPQGNMSGHGISVGSNVFKYSPREHGYIIGVMAIVPRTAYQQGLHRMWTREDKFDFAFPEFANLGEQAIDNREIYYRPGFSDEYDTWGYQSRYAEYKYGISRVAGEFRDALSYWHEGRIFQSLPALNADFVKSSASERIFPVQDGSDKFYAQMYMKVDAKRPLPYYGTPGLSRI